MRLFSRAPVLLVCGWVLLSIAWVFGNPAFAAPDEGAHFERAVSVSEGTLIGKKSATQLPAKTARQADWQNETTRQVTIPARLVLTDISCYVHVEERSAACSTRPVATAPGDIDVLTAVGDYQPLPYLLPAVALKAGDSSPPALRWGRIGGLILPLLLLGLSSALVWERSAGAVSLLGLMLAVTPMVIFCAASLTGSGLEIAAGVAFVAALLRLRRDARSEAGRSATWVWAAAAAGGALLTLSRSASTVWLVLALLLWVVLMGPAHVWRLVRDDTRAWIAGAVIAVAVVLNRTWEALYGPDTPFGLANARQGFTDAFGEIRGSADQIVLGPGYLEYSLPLWMIAVWFLLVAALLIAAFLAAGARERRVLAGTAVVLAGLPVVLWVLAIRHTGFGMQARHMLPILVALPLLAGELLRERRASAHPALLRALTVAVPAGAALIQFGAWFRNAQRSAFGVDQPLLGWKAAEWTPPLGWIWWVLLALAGAALLAAAGYVGRETVVSGRD